MPISPIQALLRLVLAGGRITPRRRLLARFDGNAEAALHAGPGEWTEAGLSEAQAAALQKRSAGRAAEDRALHWLECPGHHLVGWADADYPPLLREIASPPLALFVDGEPGRLWHPQLAIVGSRAATAGGRENARRFAGEIAAAGFAITSGLAEGIDAAAHAGALDAIDGLTLAIVGTGPERAYPVVHAELRDAIAQRGAIISEHPPGTPPLRRHFPARNRLVAGLTLGTLVIEAAERSGALISARMAADAGREVLALPGSIHNPMARGCHRLIRDGAQLVETPAEVLEVLIRACPSLSETLHARLDAPIHPVQAEGPEPPADHQTLWSALGHDPIPMDGLVARTGLTVAELSPMLLALELQGRLAVEHGRYTRKSA